jgi:MoxR-like ATPase
MGASPFFDRFDGEKNSNPLGWACQWQGGEDRMAKICGADAMKSLHDLKPLIAYGASPRASIMLTVVAKANAFLRGRGYVTPDDVKQIGMDVRKEWESATNRRLYLQLHVEVDSTWPTRLTAT